MEATLGNAGLIAAAARPLSSSAARHGFERSMGLLPVASICLPWNRA